MHKLLYPLSLVLVACGTVSAQNGVQRGEFIIEPPTLQNLGFEWYIEGGDENRNATVQVEYRIAGSGSEWKAGMPLLRIGDEHIERAGIDYTTPHMFAGSILDLKIDTEYEARFTMEDPDGVEGEAVKVVKVSTRAEPKAFRGGRVRHVYSQYYTGEKEEPNYPGLVSAYHGSANTKGDWYVVGEGLRTEYAGSKNFLIQDNVMIGRDDRYRVYGWAAHREGHIPYGTHLLDSYYGIKVYGSGHVIAHNSIAYFHDSIGVSTYGSPEEEQELKAVSIDIYNNDLHLQVDDFVEADGGVHNIRVMRNRGVNTAQSGISAQPVFGGPAYYIRNILYNVQKGGALKIHGGVPGLTAYHNTFIAENNGGGGHPNSNYRNNLILGSDGPTHISRFPYTTTYSIADYNGYRPNQGPESPEGQFRWLSAQGEWEEFKTLGGLKKASGLEAHGIIVDYDDFEDLQKPIQGPVGTPLGEMPGPVYHAVDLNFELTPIGKAVDAGVVIPNVNDNYNGKAPDLGAPEVDAPPVVYGARHLDPNQEFYR